jgi:diguanylate cyclase (GGDEF)-like protein
MLSRFARLAALIGHARARNMMVACGLLLGVVLGSAAIWFVIALRQSEIADTERELRNTALILAAEMDRDFQAAELLQLGLIERMRQQGIDSPELLARQMASRDTHDMLKERIAALPNVDGMALIDASGRLVNVSRTWPPPAVDVSDRDLFKALSADPLLTSFISEPVRNRTDGTWSILFTRKFSAPGGNLLGLVNTSMQLAHFEGMFSSIMLEGGGSFALYRRDGMLLARYPRVDLKIGQSFGDTVNFNRLLDPAAGGIVRLTSVLDGEDRLVAPRALDHFPLVVAVTRSMQATLAGWHFEVLVFGAATAVLELLIAGAVLLVVRHLHGYEALEAAELARAHAEAELVLADQRERSEHALQIQGQRFDTALNNMLQGLLMFDHAGRLLVANRRFCELFGVPLDCLKPGMSYDGLTKYIVSAGTTTAQDMHEMRQRRAALIERNMRATTIWQIENGRSFSVTHQPMQEGWLTTFEEITERQQAEARMAHLAHHDSLTDLPNRVLFQEKLGHAVAHARRGRDLALHCLDLDQFKAVNDTLGHPVGDALLQAVAVRLLERTRETDTVARLGGDEFAILQAPIEGPAVATAFAARLMELFERPFQVAGHQIVIGTSIGIAFAPQDSLDPDQLLRSADLALYRAKLDGRGIYRLFHAEMDAQMQARRLLELDLRQALRIGQLELFYQPLISAIGGTVTGFEALLRWRHPTRGIVPPGEFVPLAEEIGLIVPIGEWVLRQACASAASWPNDLRVAVNLSPAQFRSRNLVTAVARALQEFALEPSRLELEITETVMLQDTELTVGILHELHALGVRIAMDDFGTGYSSLSYLRRFPFDRLKIDQSFVRDLCKRQDCGAIIRAVAGLSNELGMLTTAEGVETPEQLALLTAVGCTEVQGYLFSPAVPASEIPRVLRSVAEILAPQVVPKPEYAL